MQNRTKAVIAGAALALGGFAVSAAAGAQGGDADTLEDQNEGPDRAITGAALDRASQAALDYLGEGRVTATEVEDEESYYEVEVRLDDGSEVDVQLDESFTVVGLD